MSRDFLAGHDRGHTLSRYVTLHSFIITSTFASTHPFSTRYLSPGSTPCNLPDTSPWTGDQMVSYVAADYSQILQSGTSAHRKRKRGSVPFSL